MHSKIELPVKPSLNGTNRSTHRAAYLALISAVCLFVSGFMFLGGGDRDSNAAITEGPQYTGSDPKKKQEFEYLQKLAEAHRKDGKPNDQSAAVVPQTTEAAQSPPAPTPEPIPDHVQLAHLKQRMLHLLAKDGKTIDFGSAITATDGSREANGMIQYVSLKQHSDASSASNVAAEAKPAQFSWAKPAVGKVTVANVSVRQPVQPVRVGAMHGVSGEEIFPLWGDNFTDQATELFYATEEATFPDAEGDVRYERPEDADELAQEGSIWFKLSRSYKNADIQTLINSEAICLISAVYTGNCRYLDESFEACVERQGFTALEAFMSRRCRMSKYWNDLRKVSKKDGSTNDNKPVPLSSSSKTPLKHGKVPAAEMCEVGETTPFVEPKSRILSPFGPPRHCRSGALHYPIAFNTPSRTVQDRLFPKLFDFHPIPLDAGPKPLGSNDEDTYQALAAMSHFCMTHSRGGWDCGRHYEVMGAGCVPYFYDIKAAGPYIVPQLPRKLLMDIVSLPLFENIGHCSGGLIDEYFMPTSPYMKKDNFGARARVRFIKEGFRFKEGVQLDKAWYWRTARKLLRYTQKYLTSEAMAAYVLKTMGAEDAKHILILTRSAWDNLHQSFITGLDGLGVKMTIYQTNDDESLAGCFRHEKGELLSSEQLSRLRDTARRGAVHGNGVPWANRMRNQGHEYMKDMNLVNDKIETGVFDAAIFTYYAEQGYPLSVYSNVKYNCGGKVAVLDHDDSMGDPRRNAAYFAKDVYFFSRELRRAYC